MNDLIAIIFLNYSMISIINTAEYNGKILHTHLPRNSEFLNSKLYLLIVKSVL